MRRGLLQYSEFGFLSHIFLSWLLSRKTLTRIECIATRSSRLLALREVVAFSLSTSLFFWAGSVITSGGYGGWLIAIVFWIGASLIVCLISPRFPVFFGILTTTSVDLSLIFENARWSQGHGNNNYWQYFWSNELKIYVVVWIISVLLSLIVSVPIYFRRPHDVSHDPTS
jgi:hypothetical protein